MSNYTGRTELPPIKSNVSVRLHEGVIVTGVVTGHGQKDGMPTFDFEYDHRTHEGQILKASKWAWPEQLQRNLVKCIDHAKNSKPGETVEMRTRDLPGKALDWAVANALHTVKFGEPHDLKSILDGVHLSVEAVKNFSPTSNSTLALNLIVQEGVRIEHYESSPRSGWDDFSAIKGECHFIGATAEIAGLRCIVGFNLGAIIQLPSELV